MFKHIKYVADLQLYNQLRNFFKRIKTDDIFYFFPYTNSHLLYFFPYQCYFG